MQVITPERQVVQAFNFMPDESFVIAFDKSGQAYTGVRNLFRAVGYSDSKARYQLARVQKSGAVILYQISLETQGGPQATACVRSDDIPDLLRFVSSRDEIVQNNIQTCLSIIASDGVALHKHEIISEISTEYIEDFSRLISDFAISVLPVCTWSFLPFAFLFDLYKSWVRKHNAFTRMPSRGQFISQIIRLVETRPELQSCWHVPGFRVYPSGMMDADEPLLREYRLLSWKNPYERPCGTGLLRI